MQLARQADGSSHAIRRIEQHSVVFESGEFRDSVIVGSMCAPTRWTPRHFEHLDASLVAGLLEHQPSVILLGTGTRQRFPAPAVLAPVLMAGVGIEVMDNRAAARTFNVLLGEGRNVLLALLFETGN